MNDKPTYKELENQIDELQKQIKILSLNSTFQSKKKVKHSDELKIANIGLKHQRKKKGKREDELKTANIELEHQRKEKGKREDDLIIANIELFLQNEEKANQAAELINSKIKLAKQSEENEKMAEELIIANLAVALQSELIVAKEKAEENEIQLRELNATKDKLFSIIAHDLRSPFNSILGFSELLIKTVDEFEITKFEKYLGFINSSAKDTLALLDNLLNWAKSQTGQITFNPERIILSSIIQEIISLSNLTVKIKNISLNYIQSDYIEVYADENMLKTVLRNLIFNAIKFTKSGGNINIFAIPEQNQVKISISDNGVGMNDETCKKLFNISTNITSYGTANEKGSGLGLVLCKEFVEKLGGNIWVESEKGKGSDFKFTLPLNKS